VGALTAWRCRTRLARGQGLSSGVSREGRGVAAVVGVLHVPLIALTWLGVGANITTSRGSIPWLAVDAQLLCGIWRVHGLSTPKAPCFWW
jgi:hypothetical protein